MTELTTTTLQNETITAPKDMVAVIAQIAHAPNTDVDKMERLLEIQLKMMDRQNKIEFDQSLANIQSKMPRISQNGAIKNKAGNIVSKYMKYEDIDLQIRPLLAEEGFSILHDRDEQNGKMIVKTTLKHRAGHEEKVQSVLPFDQPNQLKNAVQAAVSTFSYGKRVNVCSLLNIVAEGEDDDAQGTTKLIDEDQFNEIISLLDRTKTEQAKFLQIMQINEIADLPTSKYPSVIASLNKKLESMA